MEEVAKCSNCNQQFNPRENIHEDALISTKIYKCPNCELLLVKPTLGLSATLKMLGLFLLFLFPSIFADLIWEYAIKFGLVIAILASLIYAIPLGWVFFKLLWRITPIEFKESIYVSESKAHNKSMKKD